MKCICSGPTVCAINRRPAADQQLNSQHQALHVMCHPAISRNTEAERDELICVYCACVSGRHLFVSTQQQQQLSQQEQQLCDMPVACTTEEAGIPGLQLLPDFITAQEEQELLQHIDQQPWQNLSKRRVQHYGYKFEYTQRGVDLKQQVGCMPGWMQPVVQRVQVRGQPESTERGREG